MRAKLVAFGCSCNRLRPKQRLRALSQTTLFIRLSERLSTPLQFEYYLTRALEEAYKVGQKPVGMDMIESVLAKDIDGLETKADPTGVQREGLGSRGD